MPSYCVSLGGLLAALTTVHYLLCKGLLRVAGSMQFRLPRVFAYPSSSASRPRAGCSHCNELRSFHPLRIAWSRSRSRSRSWSHRSCIPLLVSWLLIYGPCPMSRVPYPCPSGLATDPVRNWSGRPHLNISWAGQWSSICCCEIAATSSSSSWAHSHILWHYTLDQALPLGPSLCTFGPELIFHAKRSSSQTSAAPARTCVLQFDPRSSSCSRFKFVLWLRNFSPISLCVRVCVRVCVWPLKL